MSSFICWMWSELGTPLGSTHHVPLKWEVCVLVQAALMMWASPSIMDSCRAFSWSDKDFYMDCFTNHESFLVLMRWHSFFPVKKGDWGQVLDNPMMGIQGVVCNGNFYPIPDFLCVKSAVLWQFSGIPIFDKKIHPRVVLYRSEDVTPQCAPGTSGCLELYMLICRVLDMICQHWKDLTVIQVAHGIVSSHSSMLILDHDLKKIWYICWKKHE